MTMDLKGTVTNHQAVNIESLEGWLIENPQNQPVISSTRLGMNMNKILI
jgi:hypothetical protein